MVMRSSSSFIAMSRYWYEKLNVGAPVRNADYRQPPSEQSCSLPHRGEAITCGNRVCAVDEHEAAAVVLYPCVQLVRGDRDSDQHRPRSAMRQRVADRLPEDQESLPDDGGRSPSLVSTDS